MRGDSLPRSQSQSPRPASSPAAAPPPPGSLPIWLLALLFSIPLVVPLVNRLFNGSWWGNDFEAIACAGVHAARRLPIYAAHPACAGMQPAAFVYAPQVAWAAAALIGIIGATGLKLAYAAVYAGAGLWLGWALFFRRMARASLALRIGGLGLVTGGVIVCGNIAILCHALILASLLAFPRRRIPFIAAVALAAAIKPVFGVYLVVLALDRVDWRVGSVRLLAGATALAATFAVIWLTAGAELQPWRAALQQVVVTGRPGLGFLGWAGALGAPSQGLLAPLAYFGFAALMTAGGVVMADLGELQDEQRWLLGLGLAQLINPRLMGYDLQMLAPAIAVMALAASRISPRAAGATRAALWSVLAAALVLACLSKVPLAAAGAPPALCIVFLAVAAGLLRARLKPAGAAPAPPPRRLDLDLAGRPALSLVICTLDEHEAIGAVIAEASLALADIPHEIIVVDDSLDERTAEAVRACAAPEVRLIHRQGEGGLASAAIAGWTAARGQVLGVMDGDGQHDPARLAELYHRLLAAGADVAAASRYVRAGASGLTGFRDRISRIATRLTHLALGVRLSDPLSGLFLMRRDWFEQVRPQLSGVGFKILVDVIASGGRPPRTVEVATALRPRAGGVSKLDLRVVADLAALLLEKRTGGAISARLALFLAVGLTGVAVHLATLAGGRLLGAPFWAAQAAAVTIAMTSNFWLNNALTFRHQRLRGLAALRGLASFYAACLLGAALNEGVAVAVRQIGGPWLAAALAGVAAGAFCNYALAKRLTWKTRAAVPVAPAPAESEPALVLALEGLRAAEAGGAAFRPAPAAYRPETAPHAEVSWLAPELAGPT